MANTVISLKKSATPSSQPTVLANGELAINYADGKLFYKHANGTILPFNTQGGNAFGTVNANGTLVVAGTSQDILTIIPGTNIQIIGDSINDTITISAIASSDTIATSAYDKANSANVLAYNTGIGANAFTSATIAGANTAVGTGANAFTSATITGANAYMIAVQNGSNTAVGTGANAFTSATVSGANTISIAAFNKANSALANSTATFSGDLTVTGNVAINNNTLSIGGNNVSPVQSFRNKIINGNFDFWQRSTSSSTAGYIDDRWQTARTGSTFTTSRQAFTLGQTAVPNEPTYFHRTVVTTSAGAGNYVLFDQRIESVRTLAGQTATLSFWAKADASKNMAVEFVQSFGTGGSPSSAVTGIGVTTCALTTTWTKFTITVNVTSISGKTLGSNNDDYLDVVFWLDAGSNFNSRTNSLGQQSGTFDVSQVQLEAGSVATPFEMRPMQTELALCQRYYQQHQIGQDYSDSLNDTYTYRAYTLQTNMRVAPTAAVFSQFQYYSSGTATNFTATFGSLSRYSYTVFATGLTTGRGIFTGIAALTSEL